MYGEPKLKDGFMVEWYKVKPIALKVAELFPIAKRIEDSGELPPDNDPNLIRINSLKDFNAMWYVGLMVGDIERAAIAGVRFNMINSVSQVNGCLNSDSYWTSVWENDYSSEEAKNLKELANAMKSLITKL